MKPAPFVYHSPASLGAALLLKAEHGDEAKFLAGGQSLIPAMNFRIVLLVGPAATLLVWLSYSVVSTWRRGQCAKHRAAGSHRRAGRGRMVCSHDALEHVGYSRVRLHSHSPH